MQAEDESIYAVVHSCFANTYEGGSYQVQTFAFVCRNDASLVCCPPYFANIQKQMQTY